MDELLLQHTLASDEEEMDVLNDKEDARAVAATLVAGVGPLSQCGMAVRRGPK